jgi:hypothetical protein
VELLAFEELFEDCSTLFVLLLLLKLLARVSREVSRGDGPK